MRLKFEIETFENPSHLLEISKKPEFGHLHYIPLNEVTIL